MSDFDENKAKFASDRSNRSGGTGHSAITRVGSTWISEVLRRRYDAALNEALPESFVALLDELDRKTQSPRN